ncbi:Stp1/IreP family PP2C-type Ser/Thr phosphatase [Pontibacillus litoralis]|uniref:protein-serine/threonine phosphatase n=1 Tax=Pontibacillus litoralis JSM 072002 TaxID=1385512 RepID=A0A0A5HY36_9BACI|nr:Stp1/IreP family PP2C-type Ser/Thr phosphatase [Pontibacillus litoralis]KGX88497.1 protein phosphatase [Pontibacillus litoralis JSM 072002]
MDAYFLTDIGQVRSHNEDAGGLFYNEGYQLLAVVADGMGGHKAGDVASSIATSSLHNKWKFTPTISTPEAAETWLEEAVRHVNSEIYEYASQHEDCHGMGTTIVAAICTEDYVSVAHIGDSRCYMHVNSELKQITEDHSLVNELVRTGQISPQDAKHHPRKNVLIKALGTERAVDMDVRTITWEYQHKLLLCSDGLSNKLTDDEIGSFLTEPVQVQEKVEKLIQVANKRGGEDNISIAIVERETEREAGDVSC